MAFTCIERPLLVPLIAESSSFWCVGKKGSPQTQIFQVVFSFITLSLQWWVICGRSLKKVWPKVQYLLTQWQGIFNIMCLWCSFQELHYCPNIHNCPLGYWLPVLPWAKKLLLVFIGLLLVGWFICYFLFPTFKKACDLFLLTWERNDKCFCRIHQKYPTTTLLTVITSFVASLQTLIWADNSQDTWKERSSEDPVFILLSPYTWGLGRFQKLFTLFSIETDFSIFAKKTRLIPLKSSPKTASLCD